MYPFAKGNLVATADMHDHWHRKILGYNPYHMVDLNHSVNHVAFNYQLTRDPGIVKACLEIGIHQTWTSKKCVWKKGWLKPTLRPNREVYQLVHVVFRGKRCLPKFMCQMREIMWNLGKQDFENQQFCQTVCVLLLPAEHISIYSAGLNHPFIFLPFRREINDLYDIEFQSSNLMFYGVIRILQ